MRLHISIFCGYLDSKFDKMVRRVSIDIDLPIFFIKQENVLTILKIGTQKPAFILNITDKSIMEHIYKISEYHVYLCTVGPYFYVNYVCLFKRIAWH